MKRLNLLVFLAVYFFLILPAQAIPTPNEKAEVWRSGGFTLTLPISDWRWTQAPKLLKSNMVIIESKKNENIQAFISNERYKLSAKDFKILKGKNPIAKICEEAKKRPLTEWVDAPQLVNAANSDLQVCRMKYFSSTEKKKNPPTTQMIILDAPQVTQQKVQYSVITLKGVESEQVWMQGLSFSANLKNKMEKK